MRGIRDILRDTKLLVRKLNLESPKILGRITCKKSKIRETFRLVGNWERGKNLVAILRKFLMWELRRIRDSLIESMAVYQFVGVLLEAVSVRRIRYRKKSKGLIRCLLGVMDSWRTLTLRSS